MAKRNLTEKQQAFLDVLFNEAEGDFVVAKRLAGYSENVHTGSIVESLEEEIAELVKKQISKLGVKAVMSMGHVLDNPSDLGNRERMAAAKDILDRAGFKPTDKVDVKTESPVFILPPKSDNE
jgi:hypothetical protein